LIGRERGKTLAGCVREGGRKAMGKSSLDMLFILAMRFDESLTKFSLGAVASHRRM
jgi:hypothetical protein